MNPAEPGKPDDPAHAGHLPPVEIWRACLLIAASLVLSLGLLLPGITPVQPGQPEQPLLLSLLVYALFGGLTLWLALRILQRRRWARWAMLAYLALSWLLAAQGVVDDFAASPLAGLIEVACVAMEWVATAYLFVGRGADWLSGSAGSSG